MRRLTVLLLALALCLSGCTLDEPLPQPSPSPEAAVSSTPEPVREQFALPYYSGDSLHPITGANRTNLVAGALVYQGLFALDNAFTPHNVLCAGSSVSEDGLTWTFSLCSAFFSDGNPLTAADVAYSLNLARASTLYGRRLSQVLAVEAREDGTVAVTLSRPNSALPALLDVPILREGEDGSLPMGTGPYDFVWDGASLLLARRQTAPETAPEEILLVPLDSAYDLIYAFDAGNVSLVDTDLTGANALGFSAGYEEFPYPTTTMLYVGFRAVDSPCEDPLVRQALARCFDREGAVSTLLAGHADAACQPFSPRSALFSAAHEQAGAYDPQAAAELLSQAGYTLGEDGRLIRGGDALSLTFVVNVDNSFKVSVAEYLTRQMTALGAEAELKKLSWEDYLAALEAGDFDLYLGEVTLSADFDLGPLLEKEGAMNYGGYEDEETEALLQQLREAPETLRPLRAKALLDKLQADAPLSALCFKERSVLTRWQSVSGLTPTRQDPFYQLESLRFGV